MKKGYFITFEGIDGSGKTSILNKVISELKNEFLIEQTREPGGNNKICEAIRHLVLDQFKDMNKYTESLLFAASRSQHVNEYIIPKINQGINIICDRFLDSSIAYQGFAKEINYRDIEIINDFAINGFRPDFTIFFDLKPDIAEKRIVLNNREINRFDLEDMELQKRAYDGYKEIIKKNSSRIIIVDANKKFNEVYIEVLEIIKKILKG